MKASLLILCLVLCPLAVLGAADDVPKPTFLPALATPTDFQATLTQQWLNLSWKANPGTDQFYVYAKDTNGVLITNQLFIKKAKELMMGNFHWKTQRPAQVTLYSVASVVGGNVSKPSQEIKCQP